MHPQISVALALLSVAVSTTSTAAPLLSAEQLLEHCQQSKPEQQSLCHGYIMGAADAGEVCIPDGVQLSTLEDLITAALKQSGSGEAAPAGLIQSRLEEVFPCHAKDTTSPGKPPHKSQNWSNKERIGK